MTAVVERLRLSLTSLRLNARLLVGLGIILAVLLFSYIGPLFVNPELAEVGESMPSRPPSREHPLGTEAQGRDMLAALMLGTPQTLKIGLIAGGVGLAVGVLLGLVSGYFSGYQDAVIRTGADILLTIPGLAILILIASMVRVINVEVMALVVASLSWMWPTRTIRSQVLVLRERQYVQVAKLSGMGDMEVLVKEVLPNLLPYIAASFVGAVSGAILASIGLEFLGLGPTHIPTLGMLIYWAQLYDAVFRGMWWWWAPPIVVLMVLFVGLFLTAAGLDEVANPRARKAV